VVWLPFLGLLAKFAIAISPTQAHLDASARLAAEVPRQIANANTLFNVINTALFIGFTGWFARIATRLVPARQKDEALIIPKFLDPAALSVPAVALEQVRQELGHLGQIVRTMLIDLPEATASVSDEVLAEIRRHAKYVEELGSAVVDFLGRIRQGTLTQDESETHVALMTATAHLRSLADIIGDDLVAVARTAGGKPSLRLDRAVVSELYQKVQQAVELAVRAVRQQDAPAAEAVLAMSPDVRQCAEELMSRLATGFDANNPEGPAALRLQTHFVDSLRQIFTLAKRIVRAELGPEITEITKIKPDKNTKT
jgi:phosphate:Na+ symporter